MSTQTSAPGSAPSTSLAASNQPSLSAIARYQSQASKARASQSHKLISFPVGNLRLAVPMDNISRVINRPRVYGSGLNAVGVTTVGARELTIVDLYQLLFGVPEPEVEGRAGYLVLAPTPNGELMGIATPETPALLEVNPSQIRELPDSYRQADTLWVASHIVRAALAADEPPQSIFLLDMAAVVERLLPQKS